MKVLAHVHKYPPIHNAGAEWMLHAILVDLIARGHEAYVTHPNAISAYALDGVIVFATDQRQLAKVAAEADVVITHLDRTKNAVGAARTAGKPIVHLVHNDRQLQFHHVTPGPDVLVVHNSEWVREAIGWTGAELVVRPPVDLERYRIAAGTHQPEAITLINLTNPKGSGVFYDLAKAMPERAFLGVAGAYGVQVRPKRSPRNVTILEQTPDVVEDVYARTRIVLMPSSYESWGRVAIEAAVNGIPTIAAPTPGLLESLGDAGIFAERSDRRSWAHAIEALDDPATYKAASIKAKKRAVDLAGIVAQDLDELERAMVNIVEERRRANPAAYDPPMGILSSAKAGVRCPICRAASCACNPSGRQIEEGLTVHHFTKTKSAKPVELKRYRTQAGDFKLSLEHAQARGLAPAGETFNRAIRDRFRNVAVDLEDLEVRYGGSTDAARATFLAELALVSTKALPEALERLEAVLVTAPPKTASKVSTSETPPVERRVGDVLDWAGTDEDRIVAALNAEKLGKDRKSLIDELNRRLEAL